MSAPSGFATLWDLNVEGSEGCTAAAYTNTTPRAAMTNSAYSRCVLPRAAARPGNLLVCDRPAVRSVYRSHVLRMSTSLSL